MSSSSIQPYAENQPPTTVERRCHRAITLAGWSTAMVLGALHAWADRHEMSPDGMTYVDMAESYLQNDWGSLINGYWPPLYPWLISLALGFLKPDAYWKFPVVHLVNFAIYVVAFGSFAFFLREAIAYHRDRSSYAIDKSIIAIPTGIFAVLGYSLFIWSSLDLITIARVTPDMGVAAFVYLAMGFLLRMHRAEASWLTYVALGVSLGLGYLAKAPMFPLAFVFLAAAALVPRDRPRRIGQAAIAVAVFLLVAAPLVVMLSFEKGRFTFSEKGRFNYAQTVNGVPRVHWQGLPPGSGTPKHPTREIYSKPPIYEFASPIGGTYPPWYDPTYWREGVTPRFELKGQMAALLESFDNYFRVFVAHQQGLILGFLVLFLMSGRGRSCFRDLAEQWVLILPAAAALMMFSLLHIENRYIAPFVVILWFGVLLAVRLPASPECKRLLGCVAISIAALVIAPLGYDTFSKAYGSVRHLQRGTEPASSLHWRVADELRQRGMLPGDRVAVVGNGTRAYWAHLGRLKIVAEMRDQHVDEFVAALPWVKNSIVEAFRRAEAKIIVGKLPAYFDGDGWEKLGETGYFVYELSRR